MSSDSASLQALVREVFACPDDVALAIATAAADRAFDAGAVILRQGDTPNETYLMLLGRARALAFGRDGRVVVLQNFSPGDMFGSTAHQAGDASLADIVALEQVRTATLLAADFLRMMDRHSCIGLALSRMLLRQLRAATERMVERTTLSAVGRVHAELLRLAELGDGYVISPAPVLSLLALDVQTTRETVSRAVNALERRGIVRRTSEALTIIAPHRLEDLIA